MKVLQLCTYYIGNKLYKNLFQELSNFDIEQEVFIPIKSKQYIGKNNLNNQKVNLYYEHILVKSDRLFYFKKIYKQYREIQLKIISKVNIDFIHAHTLFSDGGTAYLIYKKYNVGYIINIRNTDVNVFYKYGLHLRPFIYKVLLNAQGVYFLSYAYKDKFLTQLPKDLLLQIENKCHVAGNGVEQYWHSSYKEKHNIVTSKSMKLLFIGTIDKNKNLKTLILACSLLLKKNILFTLNVIGDGPLIQDSIDLCKKLGIIDNVIFHGYINEKEKVKEIMDSSDIFVLASFKETFGLVYIEAMSQGLPIIYSKNQGIDGFFKEGYVGYSVDPNNSVVLTEKIEKIINNYDQISLNCVKASKKFTWEKIAKKYYEEYMQNTN